MIFKKILCKKCRKERKVIFGTEREKKEVCGECWDWKENKEPEFTKDYEKRENK